MPFIRVTNSDAGKPPQCAPEILEAMWPDLPCGVIGNVTACHETKIARDHWPANLLTTLPKKKKADIHELFLEVQRPSSQLWNRWVESLPIKTQKYATNNIKFFLHVHITIDYIKQV